MEPRDLAATVRAEEPARGEATAFAAAGRVARNASLLSGATLVARLSAFGLAVVMARGLGPTAYGQYGFALALAFVLAPLADLGTTQYVMREAARAPRRARALVGRLLLARLGASTGLLASLAAGLFVFLDDKVFAAVVMTVLVAVFADDFSNFLFGYFRGLERMGFEAGMTAAVAIARSAGGAALVLALGRLFPVVAWVVTLSLAQLAYAGRRFRRAAGPAASGGGEAVKWKTVVAMGLIAVFVMVYLRADAVLIGWIETSREVGFYTAAYTLMLGLQIIPWLTATALAPVFARTHGSDMALFHASWREGLRAVLIVALPLALFTGLLSEQIIGLFFGGEYGPSVGALEILVWSIPLASMNVVASAAFRGAGLERWLTAVFGLAAVLNVGVNAWAITAYGINGAAAVTIATEATVFLILAAVGVRLAILRAPALPYLRLGLALSAGAALAVLLRESVPMPAAFVVALAGYGALLAATRAVSRSDLSILRQAAASRRSSGGR